MIPFYWKVADEIYYNDVSAYIAGTSKNIHPEFKISTIHDGPYWRKEPSESVFKYMDLVSNHIANNYEKIILLYSGGTDSHTVLESFIRCKIRNINIVMDNAEEHNNDFDRMAINKIATDSLKSEYKFIFTELGYTFCDHTEKDDLWKSPTKDEMIDTTHSYKGTWGISMSPAHGSSRYPKSLHRADDKKTAVVWGYEKPFISVYDGWFCWTATDRVADYRDMGHNSNFDNIFFFYSDVVPELQVKLSWLRMKELIKILGENRMAITKHNVELIQQANMKYDIYKRLNEASGYRAINTFLNSAASKLGPQKLRSNFTARKNSIDNGSQAVLDDFEKTARGLIHEKYYDIKTVSIKGLRTLPIRMKRVDA